MGERVAKAGVAVFIFNKKGQLLMGKRIHKYPEYGSGTWQVPGGKVTHLHGSWMDSAVREVEEETNLIVKVKDLNFLTTFDCRYPKLDIHYVCSFFMTQKFSGKLENVEPEKNEGWRWFDLESIPDNTFMDLKGIISDNFINWTIAIDGLNMTDRSYERFIEGK